MTPGFHRGILGLAALLVPGDMRKDWFAEWTSELWYLLEARRGPGVTRFCLGAYRDALWLRMNNPRPAPWLASPARCILFLTVLAAGVTALAFSAQVVLPSVPKLAHLLMLAIALILLLLTTPLLLGDYTASQVRCRRWLFLGVKLGLIITAAFFGALDLALILGTLQPHATLAAYILGFRWALVDQRRRCPVCLRLLSRPVRIGQPSQIFLEWYGTEFICDRGHGLLHVPEIRTASCNVQRWSPLDASWRGLF